MSFDPPRLYELLPAIYRIRDAEQGGPLKALVAVIAEQAGALEQNLSQLYDDQFAETCAPWVLPYIGDLLGVTGLPKSDIGTLSPRAEVAHTIGYRRRKGTAAMLEQLARDVSGWPARAVEYFQLIAATQYMNHLRPENQSFTSVRGAGRLEYLDSAFERATSNVREGALLEDLIAKLERAKITTGEAEELGYLYSAFGSATTTGGSDLTHTVDVRRIAKGHGRYNIPNVGLFLWRLRSMSLTRSPAVPAASGDRRRFFFSPLGIDLPLFNLPETEADVDHLAAPINVPDRIKRRVLARSLDDYYGSGKSVQIALADPDTRVEPTAILSDQICVCDLSDWTNLPTDKVAIDPVLGRLAFPEDQADEVLVTFHYGFSAYMGGGEYSRPRLVDAQREPALTVVNTYFEDAGAPDVRYASIGSAIDQLGPKGGTVQIVNSGRYAETLSIDAIDRHIEVRAADKHRPTLVLDADLEIKGNANGEVILDGLLIVGGALKVNGKLAHLRLRHCTLVPGISLSADGTPAQPGTPSLVINSENTRIDIDHCILGGIRAREDAEVSIQDSIIDATDERILAYAGTDWFGAPLRITNSTVIGLIRTSIMRLASNTVFLASFPSETAKNELAAPVLAERRQEGCARFSYLSPGARVPARYHCQPVMDDSLVRPQFASTHFRDPAYCQLSAFCPAEIRRGADDEAEMGAFHDLFEPQREAHLRTRIDEYLRFGLEAGIFYAT